MRTTNCTPAVTAGRRAKAEEFFEAASAVDTLIEGFDSSATLYIHAGIAAADVVRPRARTTRPGPEPRRGVALLKTVDRTAARHLATLMKHKTRAGYGHDPCRAATTRRCSARRRT